MVASDLAMLQHNFYRVLGVKKDADDAAIRDAYKAAVIKAHPDKPGGSTEQFKLVQRAYETLRCAKSRRAHNTALVETQRARAFALRRPAPLDSVKTPVQFKLPDGSVYDFETAPDRLRSRFRHGDVVQGPCGGTGVIVGLASNGMYWCKNGAGVATLLFSSGMGGERDVKLVFKSPVATSGGSGNPTSPMMAAGASASSFASSSSSFAMPGSPSASFRKPRTATAAASPGVTRRSGGTSTPVRQQPVVDLRARQEGRRTEGLLRRLALEEGQERRELERATERYFTALHGSIREWRAAALVGESTADRPCCSGPHLSTSSIAGPRSVPRGTRASATAGCVRPEAPPTRVTTPRDRAQVPLKMPSELEVNAPTAGKTITPRAATTHHRASGGPVAEGRTAATASRMTPRSFARENSGAIARQRGEGCRPTTPRAAAVAAAAAAAADERRAVLRSNPIRLRPGSPGGGGCAAIAPGRAPGPGESPHTGASPQRSSHVDPLLEPSRERVVVPPIPIRDIM